LDDFRFAGLGLTKCGTGGCGSVSSLLPGGKAISLVAGGTSGNLGAGCDSTFMTVSGVSAARWSSGRGGSANASANGTARTPSWGAAAVGDGCCV